MIKINKTIGIIFENNKELKELISVVNELKKHYKIHLKIISPSNIYNDKISTDLLQNLDDNIEIYYIKNHFNEKFITLNKFKKILFSFKTKRELKNIMKNVDLVLSGVQTIFSRIIYSSLNQKVPFFVYHRHLIFSTSHNKTNNFLSSKITRYILKSFNIDEFFVSTPNVGFADNYLVLGNVNAKYLNKHGVNKKNIHIVGSLEYDNLKNITENNTNNKKQEIVYITSAFEWVNNQLGERNQVYKINNLIKYVKNNSFCTLTIRIHPREIDLKYKKLIEKYPFINLEYPSLNGIIEDLMKYDIIIGWFSTAIFEISLLNKKVLFYCLQDERDEYIDIIEQLPKEIVVDDISTLLKDAKSIDVSNIIFYKPDITSKQRIVNILLNELND